MSATNLKESPDFPEATQRPHWDHLFSREVFQQRASRSTRLGPHDEPGEWRVDLAGEARSCGKRISAESTIKSMLLLDKRWTTRTVCWIHAVGAWSRDRAAECRRNRYDAVRARTKAARFFPALL